jgi:precorrin-2 dehydrogenase / sirohydrochlorin ferrochelatase
MYPILLDVTHRRIVIIGGGHVGLRKAVKLVEAGAQDVTVISPKFADGFPDSVKKVTGVFRAEQLEGASLVFAATDLPDVNAAVVAEAARRGIWANRADEEGGDFTVGAVLREGLVTLGIWSESPALSAQIRDGVKQQWDTRWTAMAKAMQTLRPMIVTADLTAEKRRNLMRQLAGEAAMEKLAAEGIDGLEKWVKEQIRDNG